MPKKWDVLIQDTENVIQSTKRRLVKLRKACKQDDLVIAINKLAVQLKEFNNDK